MRALMFSGVVLCLMVSCPTFAVDADLPPEVQVRQYIQEIGLAAQKNDHKAIVSLCGKMLELKGVQVDEAIRFYYAQSLMALERYKDADREITLFLKSGKDDAEMIDQALAMRTSLKPRMLLEACRSGLGHHKLYINGRKIHIIYSNAGMPSEEELKEAANAPGMMALEKGELNYFLGKRIFVYAFKNEDPKKKAQEFARALDVFRVSSDSGFSEGMFMYGIMLVDRKYSAGDADSGKGWELIRRASEKGNKNAKGFLEAGK